MAERRKAGLTTTGILSGRVALNPAIVDCMDGIQLSTIVLCVLTKYKGLLASLLILLVLQLMMSSLERLLALVIPSSIIASG